MSSYCYLRELEMPDAPLPWGQQRVGLTPNGAPLPKGFCIVSTAYKEASDKAGYWGQRGDVGYRRSRRARHT